MQLRPSSTPLASSFSPNALVPIHSGWTPPPGYQLALVPILGPCSTATTSLARPLPSPSPVPLNWNTLPIHSRPFSVPTSVGPLSDGADVDEMPLDAKRARLERNLEIKLKIDHGESDAQITRDLNLKSRETVRRVRLRKTRIDGAGPGAPASLCDSAELEVLVKCQQHLIEHGELFGNDVTRLATLIYLRQPGADPSSIPAFDHNWRRNMSKKWPEYALKMGTSTPVEERRAAALTRANIDGALMSFKRIIDDLSPNQFGLESAHVFVADETKVSASQFENKGQGSLSVGKGSRRIKGRHNPNSDGAHMTATTFVSALGDIVSNHVFIAGTPRSELGTFPENRKLRDNFYVTYNKSGGSEGTEAITLQEEGPEGSFMIMIRDFNKSLVAKFGTREQRGWDAILILDGHQTHKQPIVCEFCINERIELLVISANLTSVLQQHDQPHILGRFKGEWRKSSRALSQMFDNKVGRYFNGAFV